MKMGVQKLSPKKLQLPSKQDIEAHILENNIYYIYFSKNHEKKKRQMVFRQEKKSCDFNLQKYCTSEELN